MNAQLFDHTHYTTRGSTYSQRLNGSPNEIYGVARSINVAPGDKITADVYAKYVDPNQSYTPGADFTNLMASILNMTAGTVIDGSGISSSTFTFPFAGITSYSDNGADRKLT